MKTVLMFVAMAFFFIGCGAMPEEDVTSTTWRGDSSQTNNDEVKDLLKIKETNNTTGDTSSGSDLLNNMKNFTHLHLHTSYSFNSGTIKIDQLVNEAKKKKIEVNF